MALQTKTITGTAAQNYWTHKIIVTENSTNIANNTSSVTVEVFIGRTGSASYMYNASIQGTISVTGCTDQKISWDESGRIDIAKDAWLSVGSVTFNAVPHNSDGTKTITISDSFTNNVNPTSGSASGTMTLTAIPRYATCTQSLNTKTSTSIKINWGSDSTIDYVWYSKDNGSNWTAVGSVSATSGNYTISGLTANTAYNIKTRVRRKDSQLTTDSSALSVTTYKTTTPTISLSSKTSTSVTVTSSCNVTVSSVQYRIRKSDGSYGAYQNSGTFTGLSPNTAYVVEVKAIGKDSGEEGIDGLRVTTYQKTTATISLSSKTSSSITVSSTCNVTTSSVQYRIKTSSGSYGSYQNSASFTGLSANTAYTIEVKAVGKDSGESGTATLNVTTYQKTIPTISLSSKTVNSVVVSSSCNVTTSSIQYRIKTSSGSYGSYQTSTTFSGLTPNTAYVVEVKAVGKDSGESGTATLNVTTYNIATISNYPNFNLGNTETITYANPSGATIAIAIFDSTASTALCAYRTATGTSYKFTFTDAELDAIYKKMGTVNSISIKVYLRTTVNSTNYYDTKSITVTLTGNQKNGHIKIGGAWKRTKHWINVNGTWKKAIRWINVNGTWKRCI